MDIVKRLRNPSTPTIYSVDVAVMSEAADEIDRLREEIASCTADIDREVSEGNRYMLEETKLRKECDSLRKIAESKMDEIAVCRKERDEWRHIAEQNAETIRQMMERSDEP